MNFPTARQITFGKKLGIDVSVSRTSREAANAIEMRLLELLHQEAQKKGLVAGASVKSRNQLGKVRYLRSLKDVLRIKEKQIVGVDWSEPRRHFSFVNPQYLEVIKSGGTNANT